MKVITTFKMGNIYNSIQDLDYNVYQNSKHSMCEQIISWNSYYSLESQFHIYVYSVLAYQVHIYTILRLRSQDKVQIFLIETLASYRAQK